MNAPKGERLHIALVGRRNVGKSALLNALARQQVSIVNERAGTTTDVVEKRMELLPLGPVLVLDTAGIDDDEGELGAARVAATGKALDRADIVVLVAAADTWGETEDRLLAEAGSRPVVVVLNQCDRAAPAPAALAACQATGITPVQASALAGQGLGALREALIAAAPEGWLARRSILGDLVPPGKGAVLVVPIDMEAPKGRLILPQVQTIRDLLDHDAWSLVVKERELGHVLSLLKEPPALVVCDSQVFLKVAADCPREVPLTSFSVLFARYKGDLVSFAAGAAAIDNLAPGSRVLIAESCSHHAIGDDIGRVKIPRWLRQYVGGDLAIDHVQGHDFPNAAALAGYDLAIHCGGCTTNRREVLTRVHRCHEAGVPITNYGLAIAWSLGIAERAFAPFPAAAAAAFGEAAPA